MTKKRPEEDIPDDSSPKPIQLQRRRVWRACESCRKRKIKCDGSEPTCAQCAASGSPCAWLQTRDRAALSRHYVQELEARLLHMESLFSQLAPVLDQLPNGAAIAELAGQASIEPAQRPVPPRDRPTSTPIKTEEDDDDVSESFGQLALDEYGHMRWIGGSSTMSLIQSFKALTTSPLHRISPMEEDPLAPGPSANKLYFPASVFFGKLHALPGAEDVEYPPRDLADKMVNAYFSRFHFLNPVIDKPSFLRRYTHLMDNFSDSAFARSETVFIALVFAVFACAAGFVEDARLSISGSMDDGGMGMVYYERALILQYISHANTQPTHVQCFVLLSCFLCSVNCLPQAWILIGQAVRTGQDLGLHRSPRRLVVTPIEKETRRKIWWGVYSLDRMLALALGRPLGINDSDCDVELPVDVDDEHLPEYFSGVTVPQKQPSLMTGFVALVELYKIAGRVLREVYALENCKDHLEPDRKAELQRTVEALDAELTQWCEDLPAVFKSQSETDEQVSMGAVLCSHYYSVLTTLHRNFLPVKRDQPVTAAKSTAKAVSSARSCIRLAPSMKNVVPLSHHLAFFIQHLFSSAVILLLYAMHSSEPKAAAAAMEEAKSSLPALESWEGHWPGARKCKELLIELTTTATDAVAQGGRSDNAPSPPASAVPSRERRRSVTIATTSTSGAGSRVVKNKPRRNQSRDPSTSSRRLAAVSPYRVDSAQRARSTSRKRGARDDGDGNERERLASYYQSFAASANVPSPVPILDKSSPQPSPTLVPTYSYPLSPTNTQYEQLDYGMQPSPLNGGPHWNGGGGEPQGVDMYPPNYTYGGYDGDSRRYQFGPSEMGNIGELSSTPPISSFAASGLPFRGLEFIRNYGNGYSLGEQQDSAMWQSYDPGAFEYNPDLPFTLGDMTSEDR
ncbi:fungal-specific transcription factor domain-containing protein [Roridomyces roridus]|uniref:Fungal-specific transcription factor domain-containing protein n=1 Tax=Roridomyces roridus TaxID=1738132 RepID=A0AAD7C650_9AGAR|nr:fungal-specific transcription factor domain-containing protein [Roridomyces roridus]